MATAGQGTALTDRSMRSEQEAALRRRAQDWGTTQTRDGGKKGRPPDSQDLKQNAGRRGEQDAKRRVTSGKSLQCGDGLEMPIGSREEALRKGESEAIGFARVEPGQGTSDGGRRNTRKIRERRKSSATDHPPKEMWCRAVRMTRGGEAPRGGGRSSKTKKACMADLGSDIWEAVRRRIALDCVQEVHMVKVSNMKDGARGESTSREEHVVGDTHVQREVLKEGQGQSSMERAGEDGRCTNSTVQVEAVCADNRLPLSVAAMSLSRADRGAATLSLQKRRQAFNVNKLFSAAEYLESRKGGLLQATCYFRCPRGPLCRYVKDGSWVDYEKWQYANSSFQHAVMQRVDAIVVEFGAKGEELSDDHGEVDYNEACNTRVEVERRHSQVEGSGVDDFTHARAGCRVERGRTSK